MRSLVKILVVSAVAGIAAGGTTAAVAANWGSDTAIDVQLPEQQLERFHKCLGDADQLARQTSDLKARADGPELDVADLRQRHDQLRQQVEAVFSEHDQFLEYFGANLREAIDGRCCQLDVARERLEKGLEGLDRELGRDDLDREMLDKELKELAKAARAWHKQYRQLGYDLGALPS